MATSTLDSCFVSRSVSRGGDPGLVAERQKRRTEEPHQKNEECQHNSSGPFPLPSGSVSGRIGLDSRVLKTHLTWEVFQSPEEPPDRRLAPWSAWKSTDCKTRNMVDLRRARERVGLTQTELAAQLNVSQSMVSRYETNVGQAPFDLVVRWLSAWNRFSYRNS